MPRRTHPLARQLLALLLLCVLGALANTDRAANLFGTSNYAYIPKPNEAPLRPGTKQWTLSLWALANPISTANGHLVMHGKQPTGANIGQGYYWSLKYATSKLEAAVRYRDNLDTNFIIGQGNTVVVDNSWHHIVFMRINRYDYQIIVDGTVDKRLSTSNAFLKQFLGYEQIVDGAFTIGRPNDANGNPTVPAEQDQKNEFWLDELQLYHRSFSIYQVSTYLTVASKANLLGTQLLADLAIADYWQFNTDAWVSSVAGAVQLTTVPGGLYPMTTQPTEVPTKTSRVLRRDSTYKMLAFQEAGQPVACSPGWLTSGVDSFSLETWINVDNPSDNAYRSETNATFFDVLYYQHASARVALSFKRISTKIPGTYAAVDPLQSDLEWRVTINNATWTTSSHTSSSADTVAAQSGAWHHVAFAKNATDLAFYLDGDPIYAITYSAQGDTTRHSQDTFTLGARPYGSTGHLAGKLDQLRAWDHSRSLAQIRQFFDVTLDIDTPNLLLYYNMNTATAGNVTGINTAECALLQNTLAAIATSNAPIFESRAAYDAISPQALASCYDDTSLALTYPVGKGVLPTHKLAFAPNGRCAYKSFRTSASTVNTTGTSFTLATPVTTAGTYQICYSSDGGLTYAGQSATVRFPATTSAGSIVLPSSPSNQSVVSGSQFTFTLVARDANKVVHTPCQAHVENFTCAFSNPLSTSIASQVQATQINGTHYTCTLRLDDVTTAPNQFQFLYEGEPVPILGGSFTASVFAGPLSHLGTRLAAQTVPQLPVLAQNDGVDILAGDRFGNARLSTADLASIHTVVLDPTNATVPSTLTAVGSGLYRTRFTAQTTGTFLLNVTVLGQLVPGSPFPMHVLPPANFSAFAPSFGPQQGGTRITLTGTNFVQGSTLQARIGALPATILYVSSTRAVITTPASDAVDVSRPIVVTSNAFANFSQGDNAQFTYLPTETLSAFTPETGKTYGGLNVTVTGSQFRDTAQLTCRFDTLAATAYYVSASVVICLTPPSDPVRRVIGIANNGIDFATLADPRFAYVAPFSELCRTTGELSTGIEQRTKLGLEYYPNLALSGATTTGSSPGSDNGTFPDGIKDGDRCCKFDTTSEGFKCGIQFNRTALGTDTQAAHVNLKSAAYINQFVTTWYKPCRNQPLRYEIQALNATSLEWVTLLARVTRFTNNQNLFTEQLTPCAQVPGDATDAVSICHDFLPTFINVAYLNYRVLFNNSEALMGAMGTSTDGGWLYEFELHGVYSNDPTALVIVGTSNASNALQSLQTTTIPPVAVETRNLANQQIGQLDETTTRITATLQQSLDQGISYVDVTSSGLGGTTQLATSIGTANFTALTALRPRAALYRLILTSNTGLTANYTFSVVAGPVAILVLSDGTAASQSHLTASNVTLDGVVVQATDAGSNKLPAASGFTVQATLSATDPSVITAGVLHGNVSLSMVSGSANFSQLQLQLPRPSNAYVLTFQSAGLSSVAVAVTIVPGRPHSLNVTGGTGTVHSATSSPMPTLFVDILDVTGTVTTQPVSVQGVAGQHVALVVPAPLAPLASGTLVRTASAGRVQLSGVTFAHPPQGAYRFGVTLLNTTTIAANATSDLTVTPGDSYSLHVTSSALGTYRAVSQVTLNAMVVQVRDRAGNAIQTTRSVHSDSIRVILDVSPVTASLSAGSTVQINTTVGSALFGNLRLDLPKVGDYSLLVYGTAGTTASASSLVPARANFTIAAGDAVSVQRVGAANDLTVATQPLVSLGTLIMRLADVAGNLLGQSDATVYNMSVSAIGAQLQGTTSLNATQSAGQFVFDSLQLVAPALDPPTVLVFNTWPSPVAGVNVTVNVVAGPPFALSLLNASSPLQSPSAEYTTLQVVRVTALDVQGNQVRPEQLAGVTVSAILANSSLAFVGQAAATFDNTSSQLPFANLTFYRPVAGQYLLTFAAPSLGIVNATLPFQITVGAAFEVRSSTTGVNSYRTDKTVALNTQTAWLVDAGGSLLKLPLPQLIVVSLVGDAALSGTLQVNTSTSTGLAVFDTLQLVRPNNGTYTLRFAKGSLIAANQAISIVPGRAVSMAAATTQLLDVPSELSSQLATFDVTVHDAAGNLVQESALVNSTVLSVRLLNDSITLSGNTSVSLGTDATTPGVGRFSGLSLPSPVLGTYTLEVYASDAYIDNNVTLTFRVVVGSARTVRLDVPAQSPTLQSDTTVALPTVRVSLLDAGGALVTNDALNGTRTVRAYASVAATGVGPASEILFVDGRATLTGISLTNPPHGVNTLTLNSVGLVNASLSVIVVAGLPKSLHIVAGVNGSYASGFAVPIGNLSLEAHDAAGEFTPLTASLAAVTVQLNTSSHKLGGTASLPMQNGRVEFDTLTLDALAAGAYQLEFATATPGVAGALATFQVTTGTATQLVANTSVLSVQALVNTPLAVVALHTRDAGGNDLRGIDPTLRNISVSVVAANITVQGPPSHPMAAGVAIVAGLSLNRPIAGHYAIRLDSTGLVGVHVDLNVAVGPAERLVVTGATALRVQSTQSTTLPSTSVALVDAGGSLLGAADVEARNISVLFVDDELTTQPATVSMENGAATVSGLRVATPREGNYTMQLRTPGVLQANVSVRVDVGAGHRLRLCNLSSGQDSFSAMTDVYVRVPDVHVCVVDVAGVPLGTRDTVSRTLSLSADTQVANANLQFASVSGAATVSNATLVRPQPGAHTVTIQSGSLVPLVVHINISSGFARSLHIPTYTTAAQPTSSSKRIDPITVYALDASGSNTQLLENGAVNVSVAFAQGSPSVPLSGILSVPVMSGSAVVDSVIMQAPSASVGTYVLRFTAPGLIPVQQNVHIGVGLPESLRVGQATTRLLSDVSTSLGNIPVLGIDAGGSLSGAVDTATRSVSVVSLNTTQVTLSGDLTRAMNDSRVVFAALSVQRPRVGVYWLRFASAGLQPVLWSYEIAPGRATALRLIYNTSAMLVYASESVGLDTVLVQSIDAGGNLVGAEDANPQPVRVQVVSGPGSLDAARQPLSSVELLGQTARGMTNGVVSMSGLSMVRPRNGTHQLQFSRVPLESASLQVKVDVGPAAALSQSSLPSNGLNVTYASDGSGSIALPTLRVGVRDAGGNIPGGALATIVSISASEATAPAASVSVHGQRQSRSAQYLRSTSAVLVAGTLSQAVSGGRKEAVFADLRIRARVGLYRLSFSASGLLSPPVLSVAVRAGAPRTIVAVQNASTTYANSGPLETQPVFQLYDDNGNESPTSNVQLRVSLTRTGVTPSESPVDERGTLAISDEAGRVTYTALRFQGRRGQWYSLTVDENQGNTLRAWTLDFAVKVDACGLGTEPDAATGVTCVCAPGYFINDVSVCQPCPNGQYQPLPNQVECQKCKVDMDTGGNFASTAREQCVCNPGRYDTGRLDDNKDPVCESCNKGMRCDQGLEPEARPGFFRFTGSKVGQAFTCPNPRACLGGPNSTCSEGYEGPLCAVCADNYGNFGYECQPCGDPAGNVAAVVCIALAALAILTTLVYTSTGAKSDLSIVMKILLNYLQVIAFLGEFRMQWPSSMLGLFQGSSVSLFTLDFHPIDCTFQASFYSQFVSYMLFPVVVVVAPAIVFGIYYLIQVYRLGNDMDLVESYQSDSSERNRNLVLNPSGGDARRAAGAGTPADPQLAANTAANAAGGSDKLKRMMEQSDDIKLKVALKRVQGRVKELYVVTLLVTLFLAHPAVSKQVLQAFDCMELDSRSYLVSDMRISCTSEEYLTFRNTYGYLMLFAYCVGLLFVGLAILFSIRNRLAAPEVQARFRFLYDGYANKRFYWEMVIVARKLIVAGIIVFGRAEPLTQLYAGCWMVLGALILHLYSRPFVNKNNTHLETLSLIVTVITLMNGMLFLSGEMDQTSVVSLSIVLVIINVATVCVFLAVLTQNFILISKRQKMIVRMQEKIKEQYDEYKQAQMEAERLRQLRGEEEPASFRSRASSFLSRGRSGSKSSRASGFFGRKSSRMSFKADLAAVDLAREASPPTSSRDDVEDRDSDETSTEHTGDTQTQLKARPLTMSLDAMLDEIEDSNDSPATPPMAAIEEVEDETGAREGHERDSPPLPPPAAL